MLSIDNAIKIYKDSIRNLDQKVKATHTVTLQKCKEIFRGKTVVLCATGPTSDIFTKISEQNAIYIGVNDTVYKKKLPIDYFFTSDYGGNLHAINYILNNLKSIFLGINLEWVPHIISDEYLQDSYKFYTYYSDLKVEDFIKQTKIEYSIINAYHSIVFNVMMFLLSSSVAKIYLVGCDCAEGRAIVESQSHINSSKNHYDSLIYGWKAIKKYMMVNNIDCEIISINPRGLKGIFTDWYQNSDAVAAIEYLEDGLYGEALFNAKKAFENASDNEGCINLYTKALRKINHKNFLSFAYKRLQEQPSWQQGYLELSEYFKDINSIDMSLFYLKEADKILGKSCTRDNIFTKLSIAVSLYKMDLKPQLEEYLNNNDMPSFRQSFSDLLYRTTHFASNTADIREVIKDCCEYNPDNRHIELDLAMRFRAAGMYGKAIEIVRKRLEGEPEYAAGYRFLFFLERDRGNHIAAYKYAEKMFLSMPWWHFSRQYYVEALISVRRGKDALKFCLSLDRDLYHFETDYLISRAYTACDDYVNALKYAKNAVDNTAIISNLERLIYVFHYCKLLRMTLQYDKSEKILLSYLDKFKDNITILRQISIHYADSGNMLYSLIYIQKAYELEKENNENFISYINTLKKLGKNNIAIALLKERLSQHKEFSDGYYELALIYDSNKDIDTALSFLEKAIKYDSHNYKYMVKTLDIVRKKSINLAILYCQRFIGSNPDIGFLYTKLSVYFYEQKNILFFDYAYDGYITSPEDIWCVVGLYNAFIWNDMQDEALRFIKCYQRLHEHEFLCYRQLGFFYRDKDLYNAEKYFIKSCEASIHNTALNIEHYVSFLESINYTDKVCLVCSKYLLHNPHWRKGWNIFIDKTKDADEKIQLMQQCCDKNPTWAEVNFKLAVELENQNTQKSLYH